MYIFNQKVYSVANILVCFGDTIYTYASPTELEIKAPHNYNDKPLPMQDVLSGKANTIRVETEPNFIASFDNFEDSICSILEPYFDCLLCYIDWQYRFAMLHIKALSGKSEKTYPNYTFKGNFEISCATINYTVNNISKKYNQFIEDLQNANEI